MNRPPASTNTCLSFLSLCKQAIILSLSYMLFLTLRFVLFLPSGGSMSNRYTKEIATVCHLCQICVSARCSIPAGQNDVTVCFFFFFFSSGFFGFSAFILDNANPTFPTVPSLCFRLQVSGVCHASVYAFLPPLTAQKESKCCL